MKKTTLKIYRIIGLNRNYSYEFSYLKSILVYYLTKNNQEQIKYKNGTNKCETPYVSQS